MTIKLKRGLEATIPTLQEGELGFTTDSKKVFIGSTDGNIEIGGGGLLSALLLKENKSEKGIANGYASLDSGAKIPNSQLPDSILGQLEYKGTFNPSSGYPASPEKGWFYISIANAAISGADYKVGDWAVYNGVSFDKVDNTDAVASINGKLGVVILYGNEIQVGNGDTWTVEERIVNIYTELNDRYTKAQTYSRDEVDSLTTKLVKVTWQELKNKRDAEELIPGQQYCITNYTCTTTQASTQSAGHQFDIIVTANSVNKLNEDARACLHAGDTYFANSKLESWQLKYCLDNDTSRFTWADSVSGKGVIYHLIDEWNNDCPYDFKNIKFLRDGNYFYTFTVYDDADTEDIVDVSTIQNRFKNDSNGYSAVFNNKINEVRLGPFDEIEGSYSNKSIKLNDIIFINRTSYDIFYGIKGNTFGNSCYNNTFGNDCSSNTFGNDCYGNTFGNGCYSNTFGNSCFYNTFGKNCYSNTFGNYCCYLQKITGNAGVENYLNIDNGLQGASYANQLELYDPEISFKRYQINFKQDADGKILMTWQDDKLIEGGKYKDNNLDNVWKNLSHDIDGGTWL